MKLKRFLLRYYPPGILLEYVQGDELRAKSVDLLSLEPETDTQALVMQISAQEPLISKSRRPLVGTLIEKLKAKLAEPTPSDFYLFKVLRAHLLPLTNCAFNKAGDKFITGSYDRTCFPEHDHQLLTNRGFMFLADVEKMLEIDSEGAVLSDNGLKFASYDKETCNLIYQSASHLVVNQGPTDLVEVSTPAAAKCWPSLYAPEDASVVDGRCDHTFVSVVTTPDHDHWVRLGDINEHGHAISGDFEGEVFKHSVICSAEDVTADHNCPLQDIVTPHPSPLRPGEWGPSTRSKAPVYRKVKAKDILDGETTVSVPDRTRTKRLSGDEGRTTLQPIIEETRGFTALRYQLRTKGLAIHHPADLPVALADRVSFLKLFGFWLGDGSLSFSSSTRMIAVWHQRKEKDPIFLRHHFNVLGIDFTETPSSTDGSVFLRVDDTTFVCAFEEYAQMYAGAFRFGYLAEADINPSRSRFTPETGAGKWIPEWMFKLQGHELDCVMEGLRLADGRSDCITVGDDMVIYTAYAEFRDQLVHLLTNAGYTAKFTMVSDAGSLHAGGITSSLPSWRVCYGYGTAECLVRFKEPTIDIPGREAPHPASTRRMHRGYTGRTWCVTLPAGLVVVRRAHYSPDHDCVTLASRASIQGNCKVWDTASGQEILTLEGHQNVVYCIAFNIPYGDRIVTGSFDMTARLWDAGTGECLATLEGHTAEVVCVAFNPSGTVVATGSLDMTVKLWDVETGGLLHSLSGHTAEVVSLDFNTRGDSLVSGSFDHTARLWDVVTGEAGHVLRGHTGEVTNATFDYSGELVLTSSSDASCRLWSTAQGNCAAAVNDHDDEVLDARFSWTGGMFASVGMDGKVIIYDTPTSTKLVELTGHDGEVSRVMFNPQGTRVITASIDRTCRVWSVEPDSMGTCMQVLEGHSDEIFTALFNYTGDTIITASKDNTCRIWK